MVEVTVRSLESRDALSWAFDGTLAIWTDVQTGVELDHEELRHEVEPKLLDHNGKPHGDWKAAKTLTLVCGPECADDILWRLKEHLPWLIEEEFGGPEKRRHMAACSRIVAAIEKRLESDAHC